MRENEKEKRSKKRVKKDAESTGNENASFSGISVNGEK